MRTPSAARAPRRAWLSSALGFAAMSCAPPPLPAAPPPPVVAAPAPPVTLTPAQIAARVTASIVSIRSPTGLGTGFVVRKDGWIATNFHVISGATSLVVATPDRTSISASRFST